MPTVMVSSRSIRTTGRGDGRSPPVVVTTNQSSLAGGPGDDPSAINTISLSTMSPGNQRGTTWSGNNDTFRGQIDMGAARFPPPYCTHRRKSGTPLAGVIATAVVTGAKYTRKSNVSA